MSTIINIVVDVALSTSWWIVRKTTFGIYSSITYLIWGNINTKDDLQRKQLIEQMEIQKKLLLEMKSMISKEHNSDDEYEGELPPSYEDIEKNNQDDSKIESNKYHVISTL